jgi:hypothetical protein
VACERYPRIPVVLYYRESGRSGKLTEKADALLRDVREVVCPRHRLRQIVRKVEKGKLSDPQHRATLERVCDDARRLGAMVVTSDLSRFVRAATYHWRKNPLAWPTEEELEDLRCLAGGVPLVTFERPDLTEGERHSLATRRTGRAGRPRKIDDELAARIFDALDYFCWDPSGRPRWGRPLAAVARRFGVSPGAIVQAADRASPTGRTWREEALRRAEVLGYVRIEEWIDERGVPHVAYVPLREC